eukprot:TRINITY_DN3940_c0_g1_i2.p1 TRINITY_DN3940_c0_g1~~TRINITY_DN3940_c0_g1_i2.p1  ORF type:complete len:339 (-),score=124.37 TRINITY_DN3940_c0_g1_i2:1111-2127(-)
MGLCAGLDRQTMDRIRIPFAGSGKGSNNIVVAGSVAVGIVAAVAMYASGGFGGDEDKDERKKQAVNEERKVVSLVKKDSVVASSVMEQPQQQKVENGPSAVSKNRGAHVGRLNSSEMMSSEAGKEFQAGLACLKEATRMWNRSIAMEQQQRTEEGVEVGAGIGTSTPTEEEQEVEEQQEEEEEEEMELSLQDGDIVEASMIGTYEWDVVMESSKMIQATVPLIKMSAAHVDVETCIFPFSRQRSDSVDSDATYSSAPDEFLEYHEAIDFEEVEAEWKQRVKDDLMFMMHNLEEIEVQEEMNVLDQEQKVALFSKDGFRNDYYQRVGDRRERGEREGQE